MLFWIFVAVNDPSFYFVHMERKGDGFLLDTLDKCGVKMRIAFSCVAFDEDAAHAIADEYIEQQKNMAAIMAFSRSY